MKSKISILIMIIVFISLIITNFKSMASTSANIVVESKDVLEGDEVQVNINLQNSIDFSATNFIVRYDSSILEYKDYEAGNSLKNGTLLINKNIDGEVRIGYISEADQTSETKPQGTLITLKFKVNSGKVSSTEIKLEATTLKKDDGTDVDTNITNGKIRIASEIKINNKALNLKVGDSEILSVSTSPISIDIPKEKITWKSANPAIATVDGQGKVTAVASGTTEITATVGTKTAKCTVQVPLGVGDIDEDNRITSYDAYKILENSIKSFIGIKVDSKVLEISDVDKDGRITSYDAYKILKQTISSKTN